MADMYVAEAVVENNHRDFATDSSRMHLKQSVLERRNFSLAMFDTSFMWYGKNIDTYNEVIDKTIEILEKRIEDNGINVRDVAGAYQGDSVQLWDKTNFMLVRPSSPSRFLTFSVKAADDWKHGDIFTLRAKITNLNGSPGLTLTADYDDGTFEITGKKIYGDGWQEISLIGDSAKVPIRIYGNFNFERLNSVMVLDSIQLIKKPLDKNIYSQRYRQRAYDLNDKRIKKEIPQDEDSKEDNEPEGDS